MARSHRSDDFFCPDIIDGYAIDAYGTKKSHQLASVAHDRRRGLYRLDYSICRNTDRASLDDIISDRFVDVVADREKNAAAASYAQAMFGDIARKIKDDKNDVLFTSKNYKQATTFSFVFDDKKPYNLQDKFITTTQAKMIGDVISPKDANDQVTTSRRPFDLYVWREFIAQQRTAYWPNIKPHMMGFDTVIDRTGYLVQAMACKFAFENAVECIHRIKPRNQRNARIDLAYVTTSKAAEDDTMLQNCFTEITSSKKKIPAANGQIFAHFLDNSENLLSPEKANALASMAQLEYAVHRP